MFLSYQVTYTTNEEYLASVPEEGENEAASPDAGVGIVLDIKPKDFAVVMQESGENKIMLDASQNEKGKETVSSLWNNLIRNLWILWIHQNLHRIV